MWVPSWFCSSRASMLVNPNTAFTGVPSDRFIGGRAWKARKMNPDPSIRIRCSFSSAAPAVSTAGSASAASDISVPVVASGAGLQPEHARAVRAEGLLVDDIEPDAGMPERPVAAVAGDDPAVDHDD